MRMSVFLGNPQVLPTRGVPTQGPLTDRFGRTATDLRISITDKCNLRCTYCMPAEGMQWLPRESLLTVEEIVRLARIAATEFGRSASPGVNLSSDRISSSWCGPCAPRCRAYPCP